MRTMFFVAALCVSSCLSFDQFIFSKDASSVACAPRDLPSVAPRLDNGALVTGMYGASPEIRAACGWYRCVDTNVAPAGMIVSNSVWRIDGCDAVRVCTWRPRLIPSANFEISKYKLLLNLKATNALPALVAYLDADQERRLLWDAAVTLDSTNEMVTAAMDLLGKSTGIDASAISNLVWRSRAK